MNLVTMLEVGIAPRSDLFELLIEGEQFIARRDIDGVTVERDTAQATITTAALPVNVGSIPVYRLQDLLLPEVDQIDAAVALRLLRATDNGCCYEFDQKS